MISFIPEPAKVDDTWGRRGEDRFSWLSRSTLPRAAARRQFVNRNLSALPTSMQGPILHGLRNRWQSAFFELIVARTLQLLGACVVSEQALASGRRPDFEASFRDGTLIVEAVSPETDGDFGEIIKRRNPLLSVIESYAPSGWRLVVDELPDLGPNDSKQYFKKAVREMLTLPPPPPGAWETLQLRRETFHGPVALTLQPGEPGSNPIWVEPWLGGFSDAVERIRNAVDEKRSQVRQEAVPAVLAIDGTGFGLTDTPDFDVALLGHTVEDQRPV